jgi:hypothetical protein
MHRLSEIVAAFISPASEPGALPLVDAEEQFVPGAAAEATRTLNAAFLLAAAGPQHHRCAEAAEHLDRMADSGDAAASFYREGLRRMSLEVRSLAERDPRFADRLDRLADFLSEEGAGRSPDDLAERTWGVFFPEATGIRGHEDERVEELRRRRTIKITGPNPDPLTDPAKQLLWTANLLLTGPPAGREVDELHVAYEVKQAALEAREEPQLFWYDHPVQMGVEPSGSELVYGLRAVDRGMAFEKQRGTVQAGDRLRLVLSMSTTHDALEGVARRYLTDEVRAMGGLEHVELYAFAEVDAVRLVTDVLVPAAEAFLDRLDAPELLGVFGVRGPYGRHHSFGKAVAALWHVLVDPEVAATFKTDLDHSWPQEELVAETGASLLEHFLFPLWGGTGIDERGRSLELGAMAGSLVNEADIIHIKDEIGFFTGNNKLDPRMFAWSEKPRVYTAYGGQMRKFRDVPKYRNYVLSHDARIALTGMEAAAAKDYDSYVGEHPAARAELAQTPDTEKRNVVLNHYNFGTHEFPTLESASYDALWHNGDVPPTDPVAKDDCKKGGWQDSGTAVLPVLS